MAAVKASGVVLYAEASQPSPARATRRIPAREPQLPIHTGIPRLCRDGGSRLSAGAPSPAPLPAVAGWSMALISWSASSKRCHRCSNGTPTAS
jgi:hypothetical protein